MTNLEGRVILRERAVAPPPGVRTDLDLLCDLAGRLGHSRHFRFSGPEAVFDELRRASAGGVADYSGITWDKIREHDGVCWPCPSPAHAGTPRLFGSPESALVDGDRFLPPPGFFTTSGLARFHPVRHRAPAEVPDREFPVYLTTGRVLAQYQSGTQTRRLRRLAELDPEPFLEMHPSLALRHALGEGDRVEVETRRGRGSFRVRLERGIREDTIFAPFHWPAPGSANTLTNPALDPKSRMPEFKIAAARIRGAGPTPEPTAKPIAEPLVEGEKS
jgi:assimilatory nitrate reductase catalytic subunit